jgi:hypothetical protein
MKIQRIPTYVLPELRLSGGFLCRQEYGYPQANDWVVGGLHDQGSGLPRWPMNYPMHRGKNAPRDKMSVIYGAISVRCSRCIEKEKYPQYTDDAGQ